MLDPEELEDLKEQMAKEERLKNEVKIKRQQQLLLQRTSN
jgi:hypothetical protein